MRIDSSTFASVTIQAKRDGGRELLEVTKPTTSVFPTPDMFSEAKLVNKPAIHGGGVGPVVFWEPQLPGQPYPADTELQILVNSLTPQLKEKLNMDLLTCQVVHYRSLNQYLINDLTYLILVSSHVIN